MKTDAYPKIITAKDTTADIKYGNESVLCPVLSFIILVMINPMANTNASMPIKAAKPLYFCLFK